MARFIYSVYELDEGNLVPIFGSTRKYEVTNYLKKQLLNGVSPSNFEVTRNRDGVEGTMSFLDTYDLLSVDPGEVIDVEGF